MKLARFSAVASRRPYMLTHLTDVEGNWNYFEHWVSRSKIIGLSSEGLYFKQPNSKFVYGGDAVDKGDGDIAITELLVEFKQKHPDNVVLIMGNRDNKYQRFFTELSADHIRQRLLSEPVWWIPDRSPRQFVEEQMEQVGDVATYLNSLTDIQCQVLYLKWMLRENMGCGETLGKPETFELRRQELKIFFPDSPEITDEDVLLSFIDMVAPNGIMRQYLELADLMYIYKDTLFVHGAITPHNLGLVPDAQNGYSKVESIGEWVNQLNQWYHQQINNWEQGVFANDMLPGNKPLDHYIIKNPKNVVTTNWYEDAQVAPPHSEVVEFLNNNGIRRIVTGHQPFGDMPLVLRDQESLEVIVGDTSYSDPSCKDDNRGVAIHNLDIEYHKDGTSTANLDMVKKDGSNIQVTLADPTQKTKGQELLGSITEDGWVVGPQVKGKYLLRKLDDQNVLEEQRELSIESFISNVNQRT